MGRCGGSTAGAKKPQAATAADHRDRREKKKMKQRHAAAAAAVSTPTTTTSPSSSSLVAADALYNPLPQTGTVQEVLAACTKRNSSSVYIWNKGNFSLLETALEQLSSTTRRGAAGSEARGAALARVSEKALLLEDPTAGLASGGYEKNREALETRGKRKKKKKKKKARKSACGHSRPKASQLALAAAAAPRPKRAALAASLGARSLAATPADAVAALEAQWKAYVRKLAASSSSSSSAAASTLSALTLVGARARVASSSRESALVGRSGVVVAESRRAWHLFEREGKVSAVSKAGAELEVEFVGEGGGGGGREGEGGEEGEAHRAVVAIRVGGGALL